MTVKKTTPVRVNPVLTHPREKRLDLSGPWDFRLDPDDVGVQERWFEDRGIFGDRIQVPGCWQGQGFGSEDNDVVWDFRLEARTFRATYKGTGWYGKGLEVPEGWQGMRIGLHFGGAHPSAQVWLNGVLLGEHEAPFVPFGFDISKLVRFGRENWLAVRVFEQSRIMGLAFDWQGNWSGLYRSVELTATGQRFIEQFRAYPDVDEQEIRFEAQVGDFQETDEPLVLRLSTQLIDGDAPVLTSEVSVPSERVAHALSVPSPQLWSPDSPKLYRVDAVLLRGGCVLDALSERVGFVKLSTEGKHFLINDEPYYMRGTGDFLSNPETGCPDTDRGRWRKKLAALREYGYNYVRCQSYVYAPEYLDVADEVGLLVQSEMGVLGAWGGQTPWHAYGWPSPTPEYREALKSQWDLVVLRDVNHPSANIYCMSNEMPGTLFPRLAWQCYRDTKAIKPTASVLWTDGGFSEDLPGDFVNAEADKCETCPKPLIQHEFRWWSSFPDVRTMDKFSGAIRPYAAQIALEAAARHGIQDVLPAAAANSQRLQFLEAKGKMEGCRRDHPEMAGICHFNAMDANPSPQGIIDEFYERKHADSATWLQTNGDTVILSSLAFDDRIWNPGDMLRCAFWVSDFSHPPMRMPTLTWKLTSQQAVLASGEIAYAHEPYRTCRAGEIDVPIPKVPHPMTAVLHATLEEGNRSFTNQWNGWLYPKEFALPASLGLYGAGEHTWLKGLDGVRTVSPEDLTAGTIRAVMTERLDPALVAFARAGGRVILAASEGLVRPFAPKFGYKLGHYFFTPPANYPPYEDGHDGTIISSHPMLGDLPHEGFADLQFFRMVTDAPPLDLEPLGLGGAEPVIRVIHSYPVCRSLAHLVAYSLGGGALIISALNLDPSWPEARHLLAQIGTYAAGDRCRSERAISDAAVERIMAGTALP
ncbi:MAG: sugar-binding domain-containing protein [Candidatus Latescibacterota bacterium]